MYKIDGHCAIRGLTRFLPPLKRVGSLANFEWCGGKRTGKKMDHYLCQGPDTPEFAEYQRIQQWNFQAQSD